MEGRSNHRTRHIRARTVLASMASAAALWIVLVSSSISAHEIIVGAGCGIATVTFTVFMARTMGVRFELRLRDFAEGWRIPWSIITDAVLVTVVLVKDLLHREPAGDLYRVCGFDTSKHDPVRIARTVLAIAYSTCSPNCIVIGIDQTQSRMLFHELRRSGVAGMMKRLGAKA
jgi:hypothetical protein